jgi:hypothetical protein
LRRPRVAVASSESVNGQVGELDGADVVRQQA